MTKVTPYTKLDPSASDSSSVASIGANAVRLEANALTTLANVITGDMSDRFCEAVRIMRATKGRVIITGMGKSGHIGQKIAATLSSTGTPSFFVHPGEASHGDLGMITDQDTVLAMSNSGETAELSDVLGYVARHHIPLISMTSKPNSTLAQHSTIALVLPQQPEACPHGMAPTTSSTMMIALGDALAMALLDQNQFSAMDFGSFHPGGKLGQRLLKVSSLMHTGATLPLVHPTDSMKSVVLTMTQKGFGCAAVIRDGQLVGIITDGDLRRHIQDDLFSQTAEKTMSANPRTISKDMLALEALGLMNQLNITSLFVVDDKKHVQGLLHMHDCLRAGLS